MVTFETLKEIVEAEGSTKELDIGLRIVMVFWEKIISIETTQILGSLNGKFDMKDAKELDEHLIPFKIKYFNEDENLKNNFKSGTFHIYFKTDDTSIIKYEDKYPIQIDFGEKRVSCIRVRPK